MNKNLTLSALVAMLALTTAPSASADDDCNMAGDVCVDASTSGACAMLWATYHNAGVCVDAEDPSVAVCKFTPPCIVVPNGCEPVQNVCEALLPNCGVAQPACTILDPDCDYNFDLCVDAGTDGACAALWLATHPLGTCVSTDPSVIVCTFTPPCLVVPGGCAPVQRICAVLPQDCGPVEPVCAVPDPDCNYSLDVCVEVEGTDACVRVHIAYHGGFTCVTPGGEHLVTSCSWGPPQCRYI